MTVLEKIKNFCNGIEYTRDVPEEAKELAKLNNCIIIVGGSDDLMYVYGSESYLTDYCKHSYGWDGDTLENISDKKLEKEARQLGLKIWWCGTIEGVENKVGYNIEEMGAFSYSVNENIESLEFKVMEDNDVYCTGIIIQLPEGFKRSVQE